MIYTFNGFVLLLAAAVGLIIFLVGRQEGYNQGFVDGVNYANEELERDMDSRLDKAEDRYIDDCSWR